MELYLICNSWIKQLIENNIDSIVVSEQVAGVICDNSKREIKNMVTLNYIKIKVRGDFKINSDNLIGI